MSESEVSVIIPSHNRADLVGKAIDSALNQEDCTVQVIVVDDGSTDRTQEVLAEYEGRITSLNTGGVERGAARNLGARHATAPYLAFLDSDDYWAPAKLRHQLAAVKRGSISLTGIRFERPDGTIIRTYVAPHDASSRLLIRNEFLAGPSSVLLTKQAFETVGGFPEEPDVQGTEDWLFFIKLWKAGYSVEIEPQLLVHYLVHATNFTSNIDRVARCMWAATDWVHDRRLASQAELRVFRGRTAGVIARQFAAKGQWAKARSWVQRSFQHGTRTEGFRAIAAVGLSGVKGVVKRKR